MSYLHLPRLIFTGDFKSDVSTVNNKPEYFNNATFQPTFQETPRGLWNPEGGASFDFVNCKVRQITLPNGAAEDLILGCTVRCAKDRANGKMVDLDSQQQMVSQLWAVTLRIATADDELLFQGDIKPVGFRDLQMRQTNLDNTGRPPNGQALGASWTSVLTNIEWGEKAASSPFLTSLRSVTEDGKLSLNLNPFGYYYAHLDGRFSLGRLIGSIGPWFKGEPELFAPARRLYGILATGVQGSVYFNFSNFLFEKEHKRLTVDFGGGFPVADSLGTIQNPAYPGAAGIIKNPQKYFVAVCRESLDFPQNAAPQLLTLNEFEKIGDLNFQTGHDWLNRTGGIVVFDNLPDEINTGLADRQLVLMSPSAADPNKYVIIAREAINGYVVRADNFVQRLDYQQTTTIDIYAYQWGEPLAAQNITVTLEPPTPVKPTPIAEVPGNNYPQNGLSFSSSVKTDAAGHARLNITGNAINRPRKYIDGQIYKLDYALQNIPADPLADSMVPENISVHLRDHFEVPENPTWNDIAETMVQYSNLYPIMSKYVVDLSDPVAVKAKKDILIFAFTRDINDPLYMPATRDLSEAKRQAILKWLEAPDLRLNEETLINQKALMDRPAEPDAQLTEKQIRFEKLTRDKGGANFSFNETPENTEDLNIPTEK
jgi:hypothetical protein